MSLAMKTYAIALVGILNSTAFAVPDWGNVEKCPLQENLLAASGQTKGFNAKPDAHQQCAAEAVKYIDQTSCEVVCDGSAFWRKCAWNLRGSKKATEIKFILNEGRKIEFNDLHWQPDSPPVHEPKSLSDGRIFVPPYSNNNAFLISADLKNIRTLPQGYGQIGKFHHVEGGFFGSSSYYNPTSKFYYADWGHETKLLLEFPAVKGNYTRISTFVSEAQKRMAVQSCDFGKNMWGERAVCDVYLLDTEGIVFKNSYNLVDQFVEPTIAIGTSNDIWLYFEREVGHLTATSFSKANYSFDYVQSPNSRPGFRPVAFALPTENFLALLYDGPIFAAKELFLLNPQTGLLSERFSLAIDCPNTYGYIGGETVFPVFDDRGRPKSIVADQHFENCPSYKNTDVRFYVNGQQKNKVMLSGTSGEPLLHRKNEMTLALTGNWISGDRRGSPLTLTLFDSEGTKFDDKTLALPEKRVRTSALINMDGDTNDALGSRFGVFYSLPKTHNGDSRYGKLFFQSFNYQSQCENYQFRVK